MVVDVGDLRTALEGPYDLGAALHRQISADPGTYGGARGVLVQTLTWADAARMYASMLSSSDVTGADEHEAGMVVANFLPLAGFAASVLEAGIGDGWIAQLVGNGRHLVDICEALRLSAQVLAFEYDLPWPGVAEVVADAPRIALELEALVRRREQTQQ